MFNETFFSITPEPFQAIDIDPAIGKAFPMVNPHMFIPTKHKGIIASEFIGVDNTASAYHLDRMIQKCFRADVGNRGYHNASIAFQNAKDRDLVESSSASFAFASAPKVGFIQFDLPGHQFFCVSAVSNNGQPDERHGFEDRRITQPDLGSNLSGRQFQFKAFDDPQPLLRGNSQFIDPTATEVMKRIPTTFAAEPFTNNPVDLISVASDAETTVVFPTCFDKEQPSAILAPEKGFKAV
jgi:hypothetical protein